MIEETQTGMEQAVLACIIRDCSLIRRIDVPPESFRRPSHRAIYEQAVLLREANTDFDAAILAGRYGDAIGDYHGALIFISQLVDSVCHVRNFDWYVKELRSRSYRHRVAEIETETRRETGNPLLTPDSIEEARAAKIRQARQDYRIDESVIGLEELVETTRDFYKRSDSLAIPTGYPTLDGAIGDVHPGSVLTVLARPGIGKSNLGINLLANWLIAGGDWAMMFVSLEMTDSLVGTRVIRMIEGWSQWELKDRLRHGEYPTQVIGFHSRFAACFQGGMTVAGMDEAIDAAERKLGHKVRAVVIDYMQYVGGRSKETPYEKASRITVAVKELAKRRQCLVVLLSQVGRGEHGGQGFGCPSAEGARDSGTIEENADYLLGLWNPALKPNMSPAEQESTRDRLALKVLKGRNGGAGRQVELRFDPQTLRITEDRPNVTQGPINDRDIQKGDKDDPAADR